MGSYTSNKLKNKAWEYLVKHKIRIYPVCVEFKKKWKVGINLGPYKKGEKAHVSPDCYKPGECQAQMYKTCIYYYDKYRK